MNYVLDACSLIAFINFENGHERIKELFDRVDRGESNLYMSVVNLIEVSYNFIRSDGIEKTSKIITAISESPLIIINRISPTVYQEAARLKAIYKRISIADVIGLATAITLNGMFVTSDGELTEPEATESAPIFWFRSPKQKH